VTNEIQNTDEYEKKKKKIIFLAKAMANKQHNEYLLSLAEKFCEAIEKNIEKPIAVLKQLIQANAAPAYYRNLSKLTKEDIIEIIKDKNLVNLLEQLDGNESKH